jgi:probable rRNA maturation factor
MLECLGLVETELSVLLTDDQEIHELNRVFRRRDQPTDVLAFSMREGAKVGAKGAKRLPELLGDVVVSVDTARQQAVRRRHTLATEVRELLAHGLLHLAGYDHRNEKETREMARETRRLCRAALRVRR